MSADQVRQEDARAQTVREHADAVRCLVVLQAELERVQTESYGYTPRRLRDIRACAVAEQDVQWATDDVARVRRAAREAGVFL